MFDVDILLGQLIQKVKSYLTPLFLRKISSAFLIAFLSVFTLGASGAIEAAVAAGGGELDYGFLGSALAALAVGALASGARAAQAIFTTWETPPELKK